MRKVGRNIFIDCPDHSESVKIWLGRRRGFMIIYMLGEDIVVGFGIADPGLMQKVSLSASVVSKFNSL